jgi:CrcB protein
VAADAAKGRHMSAWVWIGVALLGGGGALARFMLDGTVGSLASGGFPLGTLAVNVSGALLLGLLSGAALTGDALVLAGTATLGSYTTFSTWMLESQRLAEDAEGAGALLNIALSLAAGVGAAALGHAIGAHL